MTEKEVLEVIEEAAKDGRTELDLSGRGIKVLPKEIGQLTELAVLNLASNKLKSLPAELGKLTKLMVLDLGRNALTNVPAELGKMANLTALLIHNNQLRNLPAELGNLKNLRLLYLYSNNLTSLPPELGKLTHLTKLYVHNNQLTNVPAELSKMMELEELRLWNNHLTRLPDELWELAKVISLDVSGNPLKEVKLGNAATVAAVENDLKRRVEKYHERQQSTGAGVGSGRTGLQSKEIGAEAGINKNKSGVKKVKRKGRGEGAKSIKKAQVGSAYGEGRYGEGRYGGGEKEEEPQGDNELKKPLAQVHRDGAKAGRKDADQLTNASFEGLSTWASNLAEAFLGRLVREKGYPAESIRTEEGVASNDKAESAYLDFEVINPTTVTTLAVGELCQRGMDEIGKAHDRTLRRRQALKQIGKVWRYVVCLADVASPDSFDIYEAIDEGEPRRVRFEDIPSFEKLVLAAKHENWKYEREQYELLAECSAKDEISRWNDWRKEHPEERILLAGTDMAGWNLRGVNLDGANLAGVYGDETDFREATLRGANVSYAQFHNASFKDADLSEIVLEGTHLKGADLTGTVLEVPGASQSRSAVIEAGKVRGGERVAILPGHVKDQASSVDLLGFEPYVRAVADFLRHVETEPPLTLSIEGEWGCGKSSFMLQVEKEMCGEEKEQSSGFKRFMSTARDAANRPIRFRDVRSLLGAVGRGLGAICKGARWMVAGPGILRERLRQKLKIAEAYFLERVEEPKDGDIFKVRFNAWRHDKEDAVWAAFALEFLEQISRQHCWVGRLAGRVRLWWERYNLKNGWLPLVRVLVTWVLLIVLSVLVFVLAITKGFDGVGAFVELLTDAGAWRNILKVMFGAGGFAASAAAVVLAWSKVWKFVGNPLNVELKKYVEAPNYKDRISFIERFHEDFGKIVRAYVGEQKVYVFIDDVDRCEVPKAADLMQSLNLLIGNDPQLIFVIGMDREKVAAGLAVKFKELLPYVSGLRDDIEASEKSLRGLEYGYNFIEKFIQIPFLIPRPNKADLERLLNRIGTTRMVVERAVKAESVETEAVADRSEPSGTEDERDDFESAAPDVDSEEDTVREEAEKEEKREARVRFDRDFKRIRKIVFNVNDALENNPRRVKQFINLFRLRAYIAIETGLIDLDNSEPEIEDWTFEKLGKLVAIRLRWPFLFAELDKDGKKLEQLEQAAWEKEDPKAVGWAKRPGLREMLRAGCFDDNEEADAEGRKVYGVGKLNLDSLLLVSPRVRNLAEEVAAMAEVSLEGASSEFVKVEGALEVEIPDKYDETPFEAKAGDAAAKSEDGGEKKAKKKASKKKVTKRKVRKKAAKKKATKKKTAKKKPAKKRTKKKAPTKKE